MNRRRVLVGLAGAAGGLVFEPGGVRADQPKPAMPGAIALSIGKEIKIGAHSPPITVDKTEVHIISIGNGVFLLDKDSRLTARLKAAVSQHAKVEYWISMAVFDAASKLLGTAQHEESVQYVRVGAVPTGLSDIVLDFGISRAFKEAAFVVAAISEPDDPKPG